MYHRSALRLPIRKPRPADSFALLFLTFMIAAFGGDHVRVLAADTSDSMVLVPAGEFFMGTPQSSGALSDEHPQRRIFVSPVWIDRYEVTNAQYLRFVEETGHPAPSHRTPNLTLWRGDRPAAEIHDHPVVNVSWKDAAAFCRWAGKRLPTEAEWEKGARGPDGFRYPWGNSWDHARANSASYWAGRRVEFAGRQEWLDFWKTGEGAGMVASKGIKGEVLTLPVGSFPGGVSPYGLHDMAGNVSEWVEDYYNPYYYLRAPLSDPPGPPPTILKSIRGGSWLKPASSLRSAYRDYGEPDSRMTGVGFRCAKDDR